VLLCDRYYASHSLECLTDSQIVPEEAGDMGGTLEACAQAGRSPGFTLEIGSLWFPLNITSFNHNLAMADRKCKLHWRESRGNNATVWLIDNIHSTDPICINCPRDGRDLFETILAVPRYARSRPQPNLAQCL
jgi:hypothetical protein